MSRTDADDRLHDRIYAAVPYLASLLLAVVAGIWMALDNGTDGTRAADARPLASGELALVVVEADWCGWCKRFRRDVAPAYDNSAYSARVPLRYVPLDRYRRAGLELSSPVRGVPTFLLVNAEGREVARLRGYPGGPDRFFAALDGMLEKAGAAPVAR